MSSAAMLPSHKSRLTESGSGGSCLKILIFLLYEVGSCSSLGSHWAVGRGVGLLGRTEFRPRSGGRRGWRKSLGFSLCMTSSLLRRTSRISTFRVNIQGYGHCRSKRFLRTPRHMS